MSPSQRQVRSATTSPLTLPLNTLQSSAAAAAAENMNPMYSMSSGYLSDGGVPGAAGYSMPRFGHNRSASMTSVRNRSMDREQQLQARRDRSLDRHPVTDYHHQSRTLARERSIEREMAAARRGRSMERDPYQQNYQHYDYDYYHGIPPAGTGATHHDMHHMRDKNSLVVDLQAQLCDLQRTSQTLQAELDVTNQKLSSTMHSIKTFWSPELKKERALRKEETNKLGVLYDQLRHAGLDVAKLQQGGQLAHMTDGDGMGPGFGLLGGASGGGAQAASGYMSSALAPSGLQELENVRAERERLARDIQMMKDSMRDMELRIDTQKQTLAARDESIKKLLEMLQSKGLVGKSFEQEQMEHERLRAALAEYQTKVTYMEREVEEKNKELIRTKEELSRMQDQHSYSSGNVSRVVSDPSHIRSLQAIVDTKDSRILALEGELKFVEDELARMRDSGLMSDRDRWEEHRLIEDMRNKERSLKIKVDELTIEVAKKDTEMQGMLTRMESGMTQQKDLHHHVAVLKESLSAKEQQANMLQMDVETAQKRIEEKNHIIEQKTQLLLSATSEKNRLASEVSEVKDQCDVKDRKNQVLHRKIENTEELLKEKEQQLEDMRSKLVALRKNHSTSGSTLQSLQDAVSEKDRHLERLKEQLSRTEKEHQDELELHQKIYKELKERSDEAQKMANDKEIQREKKDEFAAVVTEKRKLTEKVAELEKQVGAMKENSGRGQHELDRLLEILKQMEEEKHLKDKRIKELEDSQRSMTKKLSTHKRNQLTEKKNNAHLLQLASKKENDAQMFLKEKDERIEELEEALRESVTITAEREVAIAQHQVIAENAEMQVAEISQDMDSLQLTSQDTSERLCKISEKYRLKDRKLKALMAERYKQLRELSELKQEALTAAISEKDANIGLLEMSVGGKKVSAMGGTGKTAEDIRRLRHERDLLKNRLQDETERHAKLVNRKKLKKPEFQSVSPLKVTPSSHTAASSTAPGSDATAVLDLSDSVTSRMHMQLTLPTINENAISNNLEGQSPASTSSSSAVVSPPSPPPRTDSIHHSATDHHNTLTTFVIHADIHRPGISPDSPPPQPEHFNFHFPATRGTQQQFQQATTQATGQQSHHTTPQTTEQQSHHTIPQTTEELHVTLQENGQQSHQATEQQPHHATVQENGQQSHHATPQTTEQQSHHTTPQTTEQQPHHTTPQTTEQQPHHTTPQTTEQQSHHATQQTTEQQSHHTTQRTTEQQSHHATQQTTEQQPHHATQRTTEQQSHHATQRTTEQQSHHATHQTTEQQSHHATMQENGQQSHHTTQQTTEQQSHHTTPQTTEQQSHHTTQQTNGSNHTSPHL